MWIVFVFTCVLLLPQDFFTEASQSRMNVLIPKLQEVNRCLNDLISCTGMVSLWHIFAVLFNVIFDGNKNVIYSFNTKTAFCIFVK